MICHIVSAGDFAPGYFDPQKGDLIIACDAGLRHLDALSVRPDLIVGDFDSYGSKPDGENVLTLPREKDDTDTLFALRIGLEKGCKSFLLHGSLGGSRFSHSLANLSCLAFLADHGARGVLLKKGVQASMLEGETLSFGKEISGTLSLFAFGGDCSLTVSGLKYDFCGILRPSFPLGVSNEFIGQPAKIRVDKGRLTVVYEGECGDPLLLLTGRSANDPTNKRQKS